jgi:hypothetical protein
MTARVRPGRPGRILRRVLCVGLLGLAGCTYTLVSNGQVNRSKAEQIEERIQNIRQLSFKKPVPIVVKTPDEVERMVLADLARNYTDAQLDADGMAGAMLGLYPPGIHLKAETVKLLKSQIAGFYDPHSKEMVLVEGADQLGLWNRTLEFMMRRDVVGEMLLSHELTHALQDQHFDLEKKLKRLRDSSDEELALKSVAEGDATIAGFAAVVGKMNSATADTLASHLKELPQTFAAQNKDVPDALSVPLIFQYSEGVDFVAEAYERGGWSEVDELFRRPPRSTQQIIDPALYFDDFTPPIDVTIGGYEKVLPDWKKVDEDTYGELLLKIILQRGFGKDAREVTLARRWGGDQMVILKRGKAVTVVWLIVFRDDRTAARFGNAYRILLDRIPGHIPHRVEVKSDDVLVVAGDGAQSFAALAPAVWRASKIGQAAPPAPTLIRAHAPAAPVAASR